MLCCKPSGLLSQAGTMHAPGALCPSSNMLCPLLVLSSQAGSMHALGAL